MENCSYEQVRSIVKLKNENESVSWKCFFRQLIICSVLWVTFFLYGMGVGAPTVYIPQIRKEANSTEVISEQMAAMLMAIYGYGAIPWTIILPVSAAYIGRKLPFVFVSIVIVIAFIIFYTSSSVIQLLISQAMESIIAAAVITISTMVMTEYISPKYRGFFLTFKAATFSWGIWVSNAIGTFFYWKNIGLVKIILSIYPLIVVFFWPESPYWLASKGRFDKCAESHRWLKGSTKDSELELQRLLSAQNKVIASNSKISFNALIQKEFYKSTLLGVCVFSLFTFSGKMACVFYSLDILKKMTSNESTAYTGMLILDGVTVLAMYIGAILSRFVKRRTLFFSSSYVGIAALFVLSLYVYLVNLSVIPENSYIAIILLSAYSMGIGCGPILLCSSLYAELLPLKSRSLAICIVSIIEKIVSGFVTQITPVVIRRLGLHAAFLCFGISSSVCIALLYVYMPETKDKTLHEIADTIKGVKPSEEEKQLKSEDS